MSSISQLFDPLGLINPIITKAKLIMQKLWSLKIDWDEPIPGSIHRMWGSFVREVSNFDKICFQRSVICLFICLCTKAIHIELVRALTSDSFINALKRLTSRRGNMS